MPNRVFAAALRGKATAPYPGTTCRSDDGEKQETLVFLTGSEPGNSVDGAASPFPRHEYVSAEVAYFGREGLPRTPVDVTVEMAKYAIDALAVRRERAATLPAHPGKAMHESFPRREGLYGPVLCLAGADDEMWDSPRLCAMAMRYLKAHHHPFADRRIVYPNAGHTFLWAMHVPKSAITSYSIGGSTVMDLGGTVAGDMAAAKRAWPTIWAFLAHALPQGAR